jgi:hypothetical protein
LGGLRLGERAGSWTDRNPPKDKLRLRAAGSQGRRFGDRRHTLERKRAI